MLSLTRLRKTVLHNEVRALAGVRAPDHNAKREVRGGVQREAELASW